MGDERPSGIGPDLESEGVAVADLGPGQKVVGTVGGPGGESVLMVRVGDEVLAIGARCSHYGGPLGEGLVVGDTVRCPWHHACFSLRTGEAECAPALNPVSAFTVELRKDRYHVSGHKTTTPRSLAQSAPARVVIVGAGAAGNACAEMLRRSGYDGQLTLIGSEYTVPYDRPALSKDYLAGLAPDEALPLRPRDFYTQQRIELFVGARVTNVDLRQHQVITDNGRMRGFDALVLATGAVPRKLDIVGHDSPSVQYLRSLADSRALLARSGNARSIVILGASFIGLEAAASLRARSIDVHVVAPGKLPLERQLGPELGAWIRTLHEAHGVHFHLGDVAGAITADAVYTKGEKRLPADLVVVGMGVHPSVELGDQMGLAMADDGISVDQHLETSIPGVYAIGDIASYPDVRTGRRQRIEHWVMAERQGQAVARTIAGGPGQRVPFGAVPFFWSQHYDVTISYVGHAPKWDHVEVLGSLEKRDAAVVYREHGKVLAVATVNRDLLSLAVEAAFERGQDVEALLSASTPAVASA